MDKLFNPIRTGRGRRPFTVPSETIRRVWATTVLVPELKSREGLKDLLYEEGVPYDCLKTVSENIILRARKIGVWA